MVVVVIIGLLAAVILPNVFGNVEKAQINKAKADIQAIETALTMFKLDNYKFPSTDLGLQALVTSVPTIPRSATGAPMATSSASRWIPGAIPTSTSSPARAARSTTSTPSVPMGRKVAKKPMPTLATGTWDSKPRYPRVLTSRRA